MNAIDLLRSSLFVVAHWFGGSFGAAIVAASITLRIAMLPITIPATRRRLIRERRMQVLAPSIEALRKRYAKEPEKLMAATQELYAANGVSLLDRRSLFDTFVQFPPAALLYGAIARLGRDVGGFLWVPSLLTPDRALAVLAGLTTAGAAWLAARSPESAQTVRILPFAVAGLVSYLVLSHISAGVALYSVTSSVVAAVEQAFVRRSLPRVAV